jgi:hypothetical protein
MPLPLIAVVALITLGCPHMSVSPMLLLLLLLLLLMVHGDQVRSSCLPATSHHLFLLLLT